MCEVAEAVGVERSTLARTIKPLVKEGYVADVKPAQARNSRLVLTEKGEEVFQEAHRLWVQEQDKVASELGPVGEKTFSDFLQMMGRVSA